MTARALRGSEEHAADRILRASFWSPSTLSHHADVIAIATKRAMR